MAGRSPAQLDREIAEALADDPIPDSIDVTDRLIEDASSGYGETIKLVATARPARNLGESSALRAALESLRARPDKTVGAISKALAYSRAMTREKKRDHTNLIRLIKGGHVRVCEVPGPPPAGTVAHRETPDAYRYYVLHVGARAAS